MLVFVRINDKILLRSVQWITPLLVLNYFIKLERTNKISHNNCLNHGVTNFFFNSIMDAQSTVFKIDPFLGDYQLLETCSIQIMNKEL